MPSMGLLTMAIDGSNMHRPNNHIIQQQQHHREAKLTSQNGPNDGTRALAKIGLCEDAKGRKKKSASGTTCAPLGMSAIWRRRQKSNLVGTQSAACPIELAKSANYAAPTQMATMATRTSRNQQFKQLQNNNNNVDNGERTLNDYGQFDMPPLHPKYSRPGKIKNNATSKGKFLNKNKAADEDGYTDIDQHAFVVDVLRLKNRDFLQRHQQYVQHHHRFSDQSGHHFGSARNINTIGTKIQENYIAPPNMATSKVSYSAMDLNTMNNRINNYQRRTIEKSSAMTLNNLRIGAFPATALNSPVKSCKKIIAQKSQRALSPPNLQSLNANSKNGSLMITQQSMVFNRNRAMSCQNLLNGQGHYNLRRRIPENNFERSCLSGERIDPAPKLPSRQLSREGSVKKHIIPDEMSWQKAEENLQQLIQSIESATDQNCRSESEDFESFYNELPIGNSKAKAEENDDGIYNELPYATKTKKMSIQQNAKISDAQNNIKYDFNMSKFVNQFLATDVRQLAAWMCEEDCRAFGWPPSSAMPHNQIQHFWWSLNEFGEQIRKQIRERSKMVQNLVRNSLHLKPSLLMDIEKKWILLADEMYTSFGNHFAFINIVKRLMKIENFPCNAGDDMKSLFQQKLLPIFNSINSMKIPENSINTTNNLLLPNVVPFLDELFDAGCSANPSTKFGNFQAKIDLLWTFARLTQRMFMEYGDETTAGNATGNGEGFNQINSSSSKMPNQNTCQQLRPPIERRMAPINPFSDANIELVLRST